VSRALLVAALTALFPAAGHAWGTNGHAMVADIALAQLSDPASGSPAALSEIR
jgi:hypothetical protein